jgi:hypothetical protein
MQTLSSALGFGAAQSCSAGILLKKITILEALWSELNGYALPENSFS